MQNKLSDFQMLPDEQGTIVEPGWGTKLLFDYQPRNIKLERMKIKEWDSYILISSSGDYAFTMHLADKRAMGQTSACFYDIKNGLKYDCFNPKFLHGGKITLSPTSESGSSVVKGLFCDFMYLVNSDDRHLYCKYSKVFDADIEANLHVAYDSQAESLAVLLPMNDDDTQFYCNQSVTCMPASGYVLLDRIKYEFDPEKDFAVLDFGRGVWSDKCRRVFCTGSSIVNGKPFGFNIGYGLGKTDAASENAFFYDGKCHKLDKVYINYPFLGSEKICTVKSNDKRFEMQIEPLYCCEKEHDLSVTGQHEKIMFGRMSGIAVTDDGEKLEINDLICCFEQSTGKY